MKGMLRSVAIARADLPRDVLERVLKALPVKDVEDLIKDEKNLPGIVENCLEELDYVNSILLKLMEGRKRTDMKKKPLDMLKINFISEVTYITIPSDVLTKIFYFDPLVEAHPLLECNFFLVVKIKHTNGNRVFKGNIG